MRGLAVAGGGAGAAVVRPEAVGGAEWGGALVAGALVVEATVWVMVGTRAP